MKIISVLAVVSLAISSVWGSAQIVSSSNLAMKREKRVDTLMKSYHRTTGQNSALTEDVFKSTSQQISSQTLSGVTSNIS